MSLPMRDREMEDMTLTMHREGKLRNKESKGRDRGTSRAFEEGTAIGCGITLKAPTWHAVAGFLQGLCSLSPHPPNTGHPLPG